MKQKTKNLLISLGLLSPSIVLVGVFVYGFIARTVQISILDWNTFAKLLRAEKDYVGLKNYLNLFMDPRFQTDLWNTLFFTGFFIIGSLTIGILLSILLNDKPKGGYIFQNIYLFPMAISFVVTGTVWRWIFSPGTLPNNPYGINLLFEKLGLTSLQWSWFTSTESVFFF